MAHILNHALSNKEFVKVFNAREYTSSSNHHWISSLQRGKEYKGIDISHIDGGKSGFTDEEMCIRDRQVCLKKLNLQKQVMQLRL